MLEVSFYPLQRDFLILIVRFCSIDLSERKGKKREVCQLRVNTESCFPVMNTKMLIRFYSEAFNIHNLCAVFFSVSVAIGWYIMLSCCIQASCLSQLHCISHCFCSTCMHIECSVPSLRTCWLSGDEDSSFPILKQMS